jgi:inner membrane transporter RhtA
MRFAAAVTNDVPPQAWFLISAVFHYLGPAFAVLLFEQLGPLGVAWLRICSAAFVLALFTRPWRIFIKIRGSEGRLLVAFGICLAAMNSVFYLALARLPLSLVAAIEFVGTLSLALYGVRSRRNLAALAAAIAGTLLIRRIGWSGDGLGLIFAAANAVLFVAYVVLGQRLAARGAGTGIARLGAAMAVAAVVALPVGLGEASRALSSPVLLAAAFGVGISSSVVPYVCDQLALARLPRASFALMLSLLPATATAVGALVLGQVPGPRDLAGVALVAGGVALHRPLPERARLSRASA